VLVQNFLSTFRYNMFKILIVEDEARLLTVITQTLELYDYTVIAAPNGAEGLKAFYKYKPDIALIDIMMPKLDGFSLVKEIRKTDEEIPVIFLTAKSQTTDLIKGFELGCNDYVKKPFVLDELLARIKALLARSKKNTQQSPPEEIFRFGSFKFNYHIQELSINDSKTITLSYKEAEILRRLAAKKNQVVESISLLNDLWGDDNFYTSRTLNVFITKLRQYLKTDDRVQILNVRAIGFKLIEKESISI
jgi:two-component system response regulator VicR